MKILLTGATGLLGSAICAAADGVHDVVRMDINEAVKPDGICASITDAQAVADAASGCDAIIHTAAMHGGFHGKASNTEFLETNVIGTENIFAAALKHGIQRVVLSSSLGVCVGLDWSASGRVELTEDSPTKPDWVYPLSKVMCEQMGSFYARQHGLQVVSLRYMAISDRPVDSIGFALLARVMTADDAATANLLAATREGLYDHILNLGPDTPLTQSDINLAATEPLAVIERHWPGSTDILRERDLSPKSNVFWPVTRIDRARSVLGWQPTTGFEQYLRSLGWTGTPAAACVEA